MVPLAWIDETRRDLVRVVVVVVVRRRWKLVVVVAAVTKHVWCDYYPALRLVTRIVVLVDPLSRE